MSIRGRVRLKRRFKVYPGSRSARAAEQLEGRLLLAAHIVGSSTVYSTIQAAVDAASPGAVINVDAGVLDEGVNVTKTLSIRGARAGVDARSNARQGFAGETLIRGAQVADGKTSAFYINANDVTIDGFDIQGNTSIAQYGAGIVIAPNRAGTHIINNVIDKNVSGLFLANNSASDGALIQHNVFAYNNNLGADGGRGIYSDGGIAGPVLTNVTIDSNQFLGNAGDYRTTTGLEAAISLESRSATPQSNIRITNNTFEENGKAFLAWDASNLLFQGNVITSSLDTNSGSIRFEGGANNATISSNNIFDNLAPALTIDSKSFDATSSAISFTGNNLYGNGYDLANNALLMNGSSYAGTLNATGNWWGSASGPGGDFAGSGNHLAANGNSVDIAPFATTPVVGQESPFTGLADSPDVTIQAENYDEGGRNIAYATTNATNKFDVYRATGINTEWGSDTDGTLDIKSLKAGEFVAYTVNVPQPGTYHLDFRIAANSAGGMFHATVDGATAGAMMAIPNTGGTQTWQTVTGGNFSLAAGQHVIRIVIDANGASGVGASFNWLRLDTVSTTGPTLPSAPTGLSATAVSTSQINLAWTNTASNQTGFEIDRSSDGTNFLMLTTVGASTTTFSNTALAAGTTYFYRIEATNLAGASAPSNIAKAVTQSPVTTVTTYLSDLASASATVGYATINKDASSDGNPIRLRGTTYAKGIGTHAVSQIVYNLDGDYQTFLADVGVDDEVGNLGSVIFQVIGDGKTLYNSGALTGGGVVGHINVDVTGIQQLTLLATNGIANSIDYDHADWAGARVVGPAIVPAAPTNLTASAVSSSQIKLTWSHPLGNQTGYQIDRSANGTTFSPLTMVGPGTTTFTDTGLSAGIKYFYRVEAINPAGTSLASNIASTTTLAQSTVTYLSDLNWTSATVGYGSIHKGASIDGNTLTLNGTTSQKGIGTHANSRIVYNIAGKYTQFQADLGVDDEVGGLGRINFQVLGDGAVLYTSPTLTGSSATVHLNLNVTGVKTLTLIARTATPGDIDYDHADWANAQLT